MTSTHLLTAVFLLTFLLSACRPEGQSSELAPLPENYTASQDGDTVRDSTYRFPYNLHEPDTTIKMPGRLAELSALAMSPDERYLVTVQDEVGSLYFINLENGEVEQEYKFGKNGDYEGLATVGNTFYVLNSSGSITAIQDWTAPRPLTNKYNTPLKKSNDTEGLCYDARNNRLLIAGKGGSLYANGMKELREKKTIYSFNLATKKLDSLPAYEIRLDKIRNLFSMPPLGRKMEKFVGFLSGERNNLTFGPSALAFHPLTDELYILSSVGKTLMVLSREGEILYLEKLDETFHVQPEGLEFDRKGILYISNEGKSGKGLIYRFRPQSDQAAQ